MSLNSYSHVLGSTIAVPGSVANLGGGFDTLGVAVQLYLRVRIVGVDDDGGSRLVVDRSTPPVTGANALERAFALAVERLQVRTPTVHVEVESEIPMAAGLGSSAAASVAGLRTFERVTQPLADGVILGLATAAEGHADNAAPALFGGLTSVLEIEGADPMAFRWTWPRELQLVVATPDVGLATAKARAALSPTIARRDAIFNLQRVTALLHALEHRQFDRLREAVRDRWHQPARASLVPLLDEALRLEDADVLAAFLSGAGPSIAVLAVNHVDGVSARLSALYAAAGVTATVRILTVHDAPDAGMLGDAHRSFDQRAGVLAPAQGSTA